jgi:hypothetical protein
MCASSTMTAFAANGISGGTSLTKSPFDAIRTDFPITSIDGVEVPKQNLSSKSIKVSNNRVKSFSTADYAGTKAVADKKLQL